MFLILTLVYQETQSNCDRDSEKKGAHINQTVVECLVKLRIMAKEVLRIWTHPRQIIP